MLLEALLIFGGFYLFMGISFYTYAVVKTYEILGIWSFGINRYHIGICKYPYWTLFWLHKIVSLFKK